MRFQATLDGMVEWESDSLSTLLADIRGCRGVTIWSDDARLLRSAGSCSVQDHDATMALRTLAAWNDQVRTLVLARSTTADRIETYRRMRQAIKTCRVLSLGASPSVAVRPMKVLRSSPAYRRALGLVTV